MIIHDRSFPHPVLAPFRDDVSPNAFDLTLNTAVDADNFYLDIQLAHQNATLTDLVREGRAEYAVHVECRRNFFRRLYKSAKPAWRITIRAAELIGRVEVSSFITASAPLENYAIAGVHSDYGDTRFTLAIGEVLAVAASHEFDAYTDYDPLRRIASILTVQRADSADVALMTLDTAGDTLIATLSQSDFDQYRDLKPDRTIGPLLSNQIVVPALLQAVSEMAETDDDAFEERMASRWFRSVSIKLDELGLDVRSGATTPLAAVQALLRLPLRRSLAGLMQVTARDGDA